MKEPRLRLRLGSSCQSRSWAWSRSKCSLAALESAAGLRLSTGMRQAASHIISDCDSSRARSRSRCPSQWAVPVTPTIRVIGTGSLLPGLRARARQKYCTFMQYFYAILLSNYLYGNVCNTTSNIALIALIAHIGQSFQFRHPGPPADGGPLPRHILHTGTFASLARRNDSPGLQVQRPRLLRLLTVTTEY